MSRQEEINRFREEFNKYLGNQIGRPSIAQAQRRRVAPHNARGHTYDVARGSPSVPSSTRSAYRRMTKAGRGPIGIGSNPALANRVFNENLSGVIGDWNAAAAQAIAADRAMQEARVTETEAQPGTTVNNANQVIEGEQPDVDRGVLGGIWNAIGGNDLFDNFSLFGEDPRSGGDFGDSLLGRAFNIIGRPPAASFGGLTSIAGSEGNLAQAGLEGLQGAWRGLSGQENVGAGAIYEAYKNNPTAPGGGTLRAFEEEHPAAEQWVARAAGALGEVTLDPYNIATPALPHIIRGEGTLGGEVATAENLTNNLVDIGETEARNLAASATNPIADNPVYRNNPQLFVDRINADMQNVANQTTLNVQGGGARHVATLGPNLTPPVVGERWQTAATEAITGHSRDTIDSLWTKMENNAVTPSTVNASINNQPIVKEFFDRLTTYVSRRRGGAAVTLDDVMEAVMKGDVSVARREAIWSDIVDRYHVELRPYTESVIANATNPTYRTIGIRIGNKEIPFKLPGKMYDNFRTNMGNTRIGEAASHTARAVKGGLYEHQFPGRISNISTRSRAYGMHGAEDFADRLEEVARDFSRDEGKALFHALGDETHQPGGFGDARMDDAYDKLVELQDEMLYDEYAEGARAPVNRNGKPSSPRQDNYQFIYNHGGTQAERTRFKNGRKAAFNDSNVVGPGEWDFAKAREMGLKPEEDAFASVWYRYLKSRRDIIRARFNQDLIENYAVMGNKPIPRIKNRHILEERNLKEVPYTQLSESFRQAVDDTGGAFYVPREIHDTMERFKDMTGWTSQDMGIIGRNYSKVIDVLKATVTLPNVGFQVRNFMGDTAMGLLDGVPVHLYQEVGRKFLLDKAGRMPNFKIFEGTEIGFKELIEMFQRDANTGMITSDISTYSSHTAGRVGRRTAQKGIDAIRKVSETRELIPRFTHYLHALREEAQALYKAGMRDVDKIMEQARDAALWRVNHYKFDYGALLPWERKLKTVAIPFYTYMRKAIPTLFEQMYMNPKWFGRLNRLMTYYDGSSADSFNRSNIPQWIRNMPFMAMTDEPNPLVFRPDFLPTGSLDMFSTTSGPDFFRSMLTKINPLMQIPIEQMTGRSIYGDMPIESSYAQYGMGKMPVLGDIANLTGRIPGTPWGSDKPWSPLDLLNDRFAGLGIPLNRVSQGQQLQQLNTNIDDYIEWPLKQYNRSHYMYPISMTDQGTFRVTLRQTGGSVAEFQTPQAAIDFAEGLPGNTPQRAPRVNPLQPLTYQDISGQ